MQTRTQRGVKQVVIVGAGLLYTAAVVYGDIMFFTIISRVFPNGFLGTLAMVGAFVAGGTALLLPLALHWWHAHGAQQIVGGLFYFVDFVILALNAMLAYQMISHGTLDLVFSTWLQLCPATPLICAGGWALVFSLDSSHGMRHARQDLEADQIDIYAQGLRNAANTPEVRSVIHAGALLHAQQQVQQLLGMQMTFQQPPALPQHADSVQSLPQIARPAAQPQPAAQSSFWQRTLGKFRARGEAEPSPALSSAPMDPYMLAAMIAQQMLQQQKSTDVPIEVTGQIAAVRPEQASPLAHPQLDATASQQGSENGQK